MDAGPGAAMESARFALVAVAGAGLGAFNEPLTYAAGFSVEIALGSLVWVPLRDQIVTGTVIALDPPAPEFETRSIVGALASSGSPSRNCGLRSGSRAKRRCQSGRRQSSSSRRRSPAGPSNCFDRAGSVRTTISSPANKRKPCAPSKHCARRPPTSYAPAPAGR